jgi:hypothetical protein
MKYRLVCEMLVWDAHHSKPTTMPAPGIVLPVDMTLRACSRPEGVCCRLLQVSCLSLFMLTLYGAAVRRGSCNPSRLALTDGEGLLYRHLYSMQQGMATSAPIQSLQALCTVCTDMAGASHIMSRHHVTTAQGVTHKRPGGHRSNILHCESTDLLWPPSDPSHQGRQVGLCVRDVVEV